MSDAKKYREQMKAKAKRLAAPGNYAKDQEVSSADWSPAAPIEADVKTGARPLSPRAYKRGGAVTQRLDRKPRATGGEIADAMVKRNTKDVIGSKAHVGAFKKGGKIDGGVLDKKAVGAVEVLPKRNPAAHYKDGGGLAEKLNKMTGYKSEAQKQQEAMPDPSKNVSVDYRKMKGDTDKLDRMTGYKKGGKTKWIAGAIKKPGALHEQLGVPAGEKIPAKKLNKAAEKGGKLGARARLAKTLGRMNKKHGGGLDDKPFNLTVVVADKGKGAMPPVLPPMGAPAPMPAAPPPAPMGAGAGSPLMRKSGGRITKVASSYKDMEAGAGSGEGRLQKTDIAKRKVRAG